MTEELRKFVNALIAMFSSSVKRVLIRLNLAAEPMEFMEELLFSLITNSCSSLSDECVGDVERLKLNTVWGMSMSALS